MPAVADQKKPLDQALDLFVYAPLGLLMNLDEVVPQLVEKGRQQVTMARMFGQFAVQAGSAEAKKRVTQVQEQATGLVEQLGSTAGGRRPAASSPATNSAPAPAPAAAPAAEPIDSPAASELAITDYDSLSASQVVPRLEGLSPGERDAVRRYEAAHRGRKTILSKLAQLG